MEKIDELYNQIYLLKMDLDALRTLVNALDVNGQISTLVGRISTVETGLSNATSSLNALSSVVTAHTSDISSLSSLSSSVSQNTSDISSLSSTLSGVQTTLTSYNGRITSNTSYVNNLRGRMTSAESTIGSHTSSISSHTSSISSMQDSISSHTSSISSMESSVSNLQSSVSSLDSRVGTNESNISSLAGRMSTAETDITTHANVLNGILSDVGTLQTTVGTNSSDITSLSTRMGTAESSISTNASNISTISSDVSTLTSNLQTANGTLTTLSSDVTTLQNNTANITRKNYVVNPDFHVNTAGHASYTTTGTEIVYVDNWRMGSSGNAVVYNYEGSHYIGAGGYIKQVLEADRIRSFRGKTCLLTICTSGTISAGVQLDVNVVYGNNNTLVNRTIDMQGKGTNRTMSVEVPVNSLAKQCEIIISNTNATGSATCNIKWLKLEMGTNFSAFVPPVDREEKYACCESG